MNRIHYRITRVKGLVIPVEFEVHYLKLGNHRITSCCQRMDLQFWLLSSVRMAKKRAEREAAAARREDNFLPWSSETLERYVANLAELEKMVLEMSSTYFG